jgi:hypothetical protein
MLNQFWIVNWVINANSPLHQYPEESLIIGRLTLVFPMEFLC